jgi:hypothetical protein
MGVPPFSQIPKQDRKPDVSTLLCRNISEEKLSNSFNLLQACGQFHPDPVSPALSGGHWRGVLRALFHPYSMESSDSMDMEEEVALASPKAAGVGDDAAQHTDHLENDELIEISTEADEGLGMAPEVPPGFPLGRGQKGNRGGVRGETGQRLANDKFFNAFDDDFDESDMKLDTTPNQQAAQSS